MTFLAVAAGGLGVALVIMILLMMLAATTNDEQDAVRRRRLDATTIDAQFILSTTMINLKPLLEKHFQKCQQAWWNYWFQPNFGECTFHKLFFD